MRSSRQRLRNKKREGKKMLVAGLWSRIMGAFFFSYKLF